MPPVFSLSATATRRRKTPGKAATPASAAKSRGDRPEKALKKSFDVAATRRLLLRWFARSARELPWRGSERDPYRVWISEVMLQQTRVEAVIEPYERFLRAFPTLEKLATASEAEVLALWSGLGYYRRARSLHAGARHILALHGAVVPQSRDELERVPGIGSYTAGALLSLAFGRREPALDANVTRVVARLAAIRDALAGPGREAIREVATLLVRCSRPGDVNEALMDLGSSICTARIARCGICPLRSVCRAGASGDALAFALSRGRKAAREIELACAVVRDGDRVLFLQRSGDESLMAGLWELPSIELGQRNESEATARRSLRELVLARSGIELRLRGPVSSVKHEIVGRKILAQVYTAELGEESGSRGKLPAGSGLLSAADRSKVGIPALPVKILRALESPALPATRPAPSGSRAARGAG